MEHNEVCYLNNNFIYNLIIIFSGPESIWGTFDYLHNTVKFPHEAFLLCPALFLVRESRLRHRIGFLEKVGKAQFDPTKPNYVSFPMIYEGDDIEFSTKVADSSVLEYNEYLKSL